MRFPQFDPVVANIGREAGLATTLIDLSGTGSPAVNNIVIADLLRNVHRYQDVGYRRWEQQGSPEEPRRVLIVIEEAHEFLSRSRT